MSRRKIYVTVGFDPEIIEKLKFDMVKDKRDRTFIVETIVNEYYARQGEKLEEKAHADKS